MSLEVLRTRGQIQVSIVLARAKEGGPVRLATIVAIGANHIKPEVDAETMKWAREFALWCTDSLAEGARRARAHQSSR